MTALRQLNSVAFFTGNFEMALADYLQSGKKPHFLSRVGNEAVKNAQFYKGIALGCLEGGEHSFVDFVPSLFSTVYGLGKGIWAFASNPVHISIELAVSCKECMDYLVQNVSLETLGKIVPELKECVEKWEELEEGLTCPQNSSNLK